MSTIFDLLGEDTPEVMKEDKKVEKKATKKTSKKASKPAIEIAYPQDVYSWYGKFTIESGDNTTKDLVDKISKLSVMFPEDICDIKKTGKVLGIFYKDIEVKRKGDVETDENTRILNHKGEALDITSLKSNSVESYIDLYADSLHLPKEVIEGVIYSESNNVILPVFAYGSDEVEAPSGENISFFSPSGEKHVSESKDIDTEDFDISSIDIFSNGDYALSSIGKDHYLAILKPTDAKVDTEKKFIITENTVISIGYLEFQPTKEDFGGKSKVTSKDIRDYLISKGRREFSIKDDISYETDESGNYIVCSIMGSKKGNDMFIPSDFVDEFRKAAIAAFPFEVLLELFYIPTEDSYFYIIPKQFVNEGAVSCSYDRYFENQTISGCIKVGEFHSHGTYPAFFSPTDNRDELYKPGIYGVIGNLNSLSTAQSWSFRTCKGDGSCEKIESEVFFRDYINQKPLLNKDEYLFWMHNLSNLKFSSEPKRAVVSVGGETYIEILDYEKNFITHLPNIAICPVDERLIYFKDKASKKISPKATLFDFYMKSKRRESLCKA